MQNTLVIYKGGGDPHMGCFWEWNACVYDAEGVLQDVYSSGYKGLFKKGRSQVLDPDETVQKWIKDEERDVYVHDLDNPEDLAEIAREYNCSFVKGLAVTVEEILKRKTIYWVCTECGCKFYGKDFSHFDGYHGIGGIASQPEIAVCEDCYSEGSCSECGEYYGRNELNYGLCEYCIERAARNDVQDIIDAIDADRELLKDQLAGYTQVKPKYALKARAWVDERIKELDKQKHSIIAEACKCRQ